MFNNLSNYACAHIICQLFWNGRSLVFVLNSLEMNRSFVFLIGIWWLNSNLWLNYSWHFNWFRIPWNIVDKLPSNPHTHTHPLPHPIEIDKWTIFIVFDASFCKLSKHNHWMKFDIWLQKPTSMMPGVLCLNVCTTHTMQSAWDKYWHHNTQWCCRCRCRNKCSKSKWLYWKIQLDKLGEL